MAADGEDGGRSPRRARRARRALPHARDPARPGGRRRTRWRASTGVDERAYAALAARYGHQRTTSFASPPSGPSSPSRSSTGSPTCSPRRCGGPPRAGGEPRRRAAAPHAARAARRPRGESAGESLERLAAVVGEELGWDPARARGRDRRVRRRGGGGGSRRRSGGGVRRRALAGAAACGRARSPASARPPAPSSSAPPATIDGPEHGRRRRSAASRSRRTAAARSSTASSSAACRTSSPRSRRPGAWAPAVEVDAGVAAAARPPRRSPTPAAGASRSSWVSGGTLYGAVRAAGTAAFTAPQAIAPASGTPALGMGVSGTAYVAYPERPATVDVARLDRTRDGVRVAGGVRRAPTPVTLVGGAGDRRRRGRAPPSSRGRRRWPTARRTSSCAAPPRRARAPCSTTLTRAVPRRPRRAARPTAPRSASRSTRATRWVAFRETLGGFSRVIVEEMLGDELRPPRLGGLAPGRPGQRVRGRAVARVRRQRSRACSRARSRRRQRARRLGARDAAAAVRWTAGSASNATSTVAPAPRRRALGADGRGVVAYAPAAGRARRAAAERRHRDRSGPARRARPPACRCAGGGLAAAADVCGDLVGRLRRRARRRAPVVVAVPVVAAPGAPRATGTQLWTADTPPVLHWRRPPSTGPRRPTPSRSTARAWRRRRRRATPGGACGRPAQLAGRRDRCVRPERAPRRRDAADRRAPPAVVHLAIGGRRRHGVALPLHGQRHRDRRASARGLGRLRRRADARHRR